MTIEQALASLICAADILVGRKDNATADVVLIPSQSVERLEQALKRTQEALAEVADDD